MRILSATDAISPAFARTASVLIKPFHWARTWKIAVSAYISTMGTLFMPFPLLVLPCLPLIARASGHQWISWVVLGSAILLTAMFWLIFMLCSRLQFAVFDVVLFRGQQIAAPWRKYADQARKCSWAKIWAGTIATAVFGLPLAFFVALTFKPGYGGGNFASFIGLIFLAYGGLILFNLAASLLNDLILPSIALEDTTVGEAWRRAQLLLLNEPGQVVLYVLLKIALGFAFQMALTICFEIVFMIVGGILVGIGFFCGILLNHIGVPDNILTGLATTLMLMLYPVIVIYWMPMATGAAMTFLEAYRLYFLAGRYPLLGDLLERSAPQRMAYAAPAEYLAPPVYPPPPEH